MWLGSRRAGSSDGARGAAVCRALRRPLACSRLRRTPPAHPAADIISRLQSFTHQNRVKCLLMTVAAHHLSDEEIGGLRKVGALCATRGRRACLR